MSKSKTLNGIFGIFLLSLLQYSCTTDDILPALELTTSDTNLSEDEGSIQITATLNSTSSETVTVPLLISGTATEGVDFSISATEITISNGQTSGSISLNGLQDQDIEGVENLNISLESGAGFLVLSGSSLEIQILDDDTDTDNDGVLDSDDECVDVAGDIENNGCPFLGFLINEVNYDPASGALGDANGDGTRSPLNDEFIEFFNSGSALDISGYTLSDADQIRHTFPQGTILPVNSVLVVFGGGTPTGAFGGAIVQTASEGQLNMSNSGDFMTLADPSGDPVLTFDVEPLSNNPNESYTRNPDLIGEFEQHAGLDAANGALFSPGTKLDGSSF
ncbi:membrane protein with Calx-beta and LTD superfamily domains [Psychroflexus torquis ATCC 700755]|uniref:Membrane protein with Calx-beta and LTD superfamily domains n=1 Tax=Psychroflexus torquis (strain ATCC 700755 / CIP 106069 / ACAM 623) TaxID=313595 RepID=K4IGH2_PSYTT|nr:lamin tail domain-containing protein [Psychroflexus torquis]AFU69454.1 membrane protein with Calx-beta and LTD superfamily domains [Psychroflexus torquis ATCC 700755]